jgi:hypothetical protein
MEYPIYDSCLKEHIVIYIDLRYVYCYTLEKLGHKRTASFLFLGTKTSHSFAF